MLSKKRKLVALLSVLDKAGLVDDARPLFEGGNWQVYGSKGTASLLNEHGIPATNVAELVGGDPILGHRVVTISRQIAAGLVSHVPSDNPEMEQLNLPVIDLAYVGLYDLESVLQNPDATLDGVLDNTDVGGILLLHAAVKGARFVAATRKDFIEIATHLQNNTMTEELRVEYMKRAEFEVLYYAALLTRFLNGGRYDPDMRRKLEEIVLGKLHDSE